jgi:hypothetical protein
LPFEVDLDHHDFVEAMMRRPEHADATWCSLSIHHLSTDEKLRLMKAIHGTTGALRTDVSGRRGSGRVSRPFHADEQALVDGIDAGRMGPDPARHHL